MNTELISILWLAGSFLALFACAEILYHRFRVQAEYTRKFVHIGTGVLTLLFPLFLNSHWSVLFLCGSFAVILALSLKFDQLKSINAIDRESLGSLLYPLSVYLTFLFFLIFKLDGQKVSYLFYYLPILTLAFADPMAALVGRRFPWGKFKIGSGHKSLTGCLVFFFVTFFLSMGLFVYFAHMPFNGIVLAYYGVIAFVATVAEALSPKGIDNLTIPASVMLVLFLTQWY